MIDIHSIITNTPSLQAARQARDLKALADGINALGLTSLQTRYITARTVLSELGEQGAAILAALEVAATSNIAVKYAVKFLEQDSGLNIGDPATQVMVDELSQASVLTVEQETLLKNMALLPVVVTRTQVEDAFYDHYGTEK